MGHSKDDVLRRGLEINRNYRAILLFGEECLMIKRIDKTRFDYDTGEWISGWHEVAKECSGFSTWRFVGVDQDYYYLQNDE